MKDRQLLELIETFLASTGMGETYFGKIAVNNSQLVARLREGRPIQSDTVWRVRVFMRYYARFERTPERDRARLRRKKKPGVSNTIGRQTHAASFQ